MSGDDDAAMINPMRPASQEHTRSRRALTFLAAVVALLVLLLGAATASAATTSAAETRVGASTVGLEHLVGVPAGITAGQQLGQPVPGPQIVVATGVATKTARLADSGFVDPSTIRFSQNSISSSFRGGGDVKDLAACLRSGAVKPGDVPAVRLVERNGSYFTLDNRRLAAFQEAVVNIPYRMATPQEVAREGWKFTTTNDGTSILIRGGG